MKFSQLAESPVREELMERGFSYKGIAFREG